MAKQLHQTELNNNKAKPHIPAHKARTTTSAPSRYGLSYLGLFVWLFVVVFVSCSKPKVAREDLGMNIDSAYMMLTREVDMLVSDSGLTKYRLVAPLWIVYDREDRKEWLFPDSLRMWSVDSVQPSSRLVAADSAIYYVERQEWLLMGNVRIHGLQGERLYTPRLHWVRGERRLYSNDSTYFYTEGKVLHGNRFEARDDLSQYTIYTTRGDFRVEEREGVDSTHLKGEKPPLEENKDCEGNPDPTKAH